MSVNTMATEDVYALINSLHSQATGKTTLAPTDPTDFISVATATLQAGTDTVYSALMQTIGRTIFSSRPYTAKFGGIQADANRWGGITRKVSIADRDAAAEQAYHPTDGAAVDQWTIRKSNVLETRYYGTDVYQDWYTTFQDQLVNAFQSPDQLGSFVALQASEMSNKWEQYREELVRQMLVNFIAAKIAEQNGVIHLLTEYNRMTGLSLTPPSVYQPGNIEPFFRWVRARINQLSRQMTERSTKFQINIRGKEISRHTPVENQKIYLSADALDIIDAMVNTVTFHDEPLAYADVEGVSYWQAIDTPNKINTKPVYIAFTDGSVVTEDDPIERDNIFGVIFDQDAMVYNLRDWIMTNTPLNARGLYWNTFLTVNIQLCSDFTEKGIVLLLD